MAIFDDIWELILTKLIIPIGLVLVIIVILVIYVGIRKIFSPKQTVDLSDLPSSVTCLLSEYDDCFMARVASFDPVFNSYEIQGVTATETPATLDAMLAKSGALLRSAFYLDDHVDFEEWTVFDQCQLPSAVFDTLLSRLEEEADSFDATVQCSRCLDERQVYRLEGSSSNWDWVFVVFANGELAKLIKEARREDG